MRILNLTVEGFGPFAGKEQIDFEQLTQEGLFLIAGPTGAGKTSILDAICFALYGKVPGSRGEVKQLRSQFATPDTPPSELPTPLELPDGPRRIKGQIDAS